LVRGAGTHGHPRRLRGECAGSKSRQEPFAHWPSAQRTSRAAWRLRISIALPLRAGTLDVDRDHAPAARLDRVLTDGARRSAGAHLGHGAGERADVRAQAGAERDHHHAELARGEPATAAPITAPMAAPAPAPTPAAREPSLECGASPPPA
jgi:hypothetical protein